MARVHWEEGALVNVKLRDDLYTIGLLKRSPYMWFFDIRSDSGHWSNVDLNTTKPLFCVGIVQSVIKRLVEGKINQKDVIPPKSLPIPSYWIKPLNWMDLLGSSKEPAPPESQKSPWIKGGKLIALDPNIGSLDSPVVKSILDLQKDRQLIESCELTTQWADQDLADRLCRYFDKGINRDDLKFEIFPGLWSDREQLRPLTRRLPVPFR
jgi:hypothetical protein